MVFCPACCTVCNNLTLSFSFLSFTICSAPSSHLPLSFSPFLSLSLPQIVTLVCCFLQCPHGGASHHFFVLFGLSTTAPPPLSFLPSFLSFSFPPSSLVSLSLSVMAYQDGFYGAADLYVSIPLSLLYCLTSSPTFPRPLPPFLASLWVFSKCEATKTKPVETCTSGCFYFVFWTHHIETFLC